MTNLFAVMGNPIAHSLSPIIHQLFAQQTQVSLEYKKILVEEEQFERSVQTFFSKGGKGLNITLPFKVKAFTLSQPTPRSQEAGSANTLWMQNDRICADNTDGIGLITDLSRFFSCKEKNILIVGAGGAARGIIPALWQQHPNKLIITNRTLEKANDLAKEFSYLEVVSLQHTDATFDLIINATSANYLQESFILPPPLFANTPFCYDLCYARNGITSFIKMAQNNACKATDGLGMLVEQAAEAFYLWHGVRVETKSVLDCLRLTKEE